MIATVRVTNPSDPTKYMTINASDYRELVHGALWTEQAEDFAGLPPTPIVLYGQPERDFAGALMLEVMEMEHRAKGKDFSTLSSAQRMTALRDARLDFERSRTAYERNQQVSQRDMFEQTTTVPVATATDWQAPIESTEAERSEAELVDPATGAEPPPPLPPLGEPVAPTQGTPETPPSNPNPPAAPATGTQPAWAAKPAAPANELKVEKGPGGKFYVRKGTEVLSEGFATKALAQTELDRLAAAPPSTSTD